MKVLCIILVSIPYILFSQNQLNESISKFNESNSIFDKAELASDISWGLKDINPDSSLYYAQKALELSKLSGRKKIEAYSLSDIGNYHKRKENYETALKFYLKSLTIRKELDQPKVLAAGYNQIGILYKQQEKYDSAAVYFSKGISIVRKTEFKDEVLRLYDGYAMTQYHLGNAESALAYLDSSFILAKQINDSLTIAKSIQNKGVINQYLGHNRLALKYYEEANEYYNSLWNTNGEIEVMINQASAYLALENKQKAEKLLLEAEKLSLKHGFEDNLIIIYMDLGELYKSKNLNLRRVYLQKAYENALAHGKIPAQIENGLQLGLLAINNGRIEEAYGYITRIKNVNARLSWNNQFHLFLLESKFWEATSDYERALEFSNKALILKDSLQSDLTELRDMSAILENERYAKEIAIEKLRTSQAEKESIRSKLSRDRIVIGGLVFGVALLSLLFFSNRKRLKIQHNVKIKEERYKNELMQKSHEANLEFLEKSLKLETEIRQKIGRDLHDHLGSKLAVIQMSLESIVKRITGKTNEKAKLNELVNLVDKSCKDVRVLSHDLISHDFSINSLDKSLENHCVSISESGRLIVNYALIGNPYPISLEIKKHIYTTITLLIDNILQHAQAKKANLQLYYHDDCINIELDDDGVGFNPSATRNQGVGLDNATKRIGLISGTIEIDSKENHGTFVSISIPTKDE